MSETHPNHRPIESLPAELRDPTVPDHVRWWIGGVVGAAVVAATRLEGASSVALHRINFDDGTSLVLRRYVWRGYVEAEPEAPAREVDALVHARSHRLLVPEVLASDVTGELVGDDVPLVLMTMLEGSSIQRMTSSGIGRCSTRTLRSICEQRRSFVGCCPTTTTRAS